MIPNHCLPRFKTSLIRTSKRLIEYFNARMSPGQSVDPSVTKWKAKRWRCCGNRVRVNPTAADARALLAQLDPPESWARTTDSSVKQEADQPQRSVFAQAAVAAGIAILGVIIAYMYADWRDNASGRAVATVIAFLITFFAAVLGSSAIRSLHSSSCESRGYLLAFFGAASLPICVLLWACFTVAGFAQYQSRKRIHTLPSRT